ncbi:hypothetical protein BGZ61DRAFT_473161 [Ilyonectria robusta]|uniref:uncharacterized protein n=1 Tax=Ilyonectria robusta TaxID=1079257 RepID=UPI001E8DB236|nr:uncharacterized protein BGZ61DRAFT_473161 [Ilyonectria robusta]KAH6991222.1 hypothetical protein BKA56DRAFT_667711 [Ilyonectria sp. MPI-CAGE-AT-0026]KAH8734423.1 hypothetical protein BGZ61DRAFT_473161 [Ilyonectria robusta]
MSDEEPKKNTILSRNKEGTMDATALLWHALCDKPKTIRKYITHDAVLAEPDREVYSPKTEPTLKEYLEDYYEPWTAFKIHDDPDFVEIDLMSSAVTYRVTAWRLQGGEMVATEGWCSTTFRQGAGGDWKCCAHHMAEI